ncbi:hypothetical protein LR48_Vigan511s000700 [Vigna angularis]|uniref:Uncharacterized protein n=1 Tax=Phaseolus angularis TaxID=3914 RepID=A0A0L9TDD8_PHAAN|nr:hypothetical protein LR48_Vigan511s000700 [Vigna angularis]
MAEENSQLNNLQEENGASELQSLVERVGDLPLLSPKEGCDSKEVSKKKKKKTRSKKKKELLEQTDPPSISVIDLFPSGDFPEGMKIWSNLLVSLPWCQVMEEEDMEEEEMEVEVDVVREVVELIVLVVR